MHGVRTIIFANSRQEVDCLDDFLFNMKLPVTSIHGERTQLEREAAMRSFRAGTAPILVATGVTARGIDVRNVMHVINYDLPSMDHGGIEEYTHRIGQFALRSFLYNLLIVLGRTGRIGHRGVATSLFTERDEPIASVLTRTLLETKQEIPEFLEIYKPDMAPGASIKFETESDFDEMEVREEDSAGGMDGVSGGDSWGSGGQQTTPAPAETSNGWGNSSQAPPGAPHAAQLSNGWGQPAPAAPIPHPAAQPSNGWGQPAPAAPTPTPAVQPANGWAQPAQAAPVPPPAQQSSGWAQPAAPAVPPAPVTAPPAATGGWGNAMPAAPAAPVQAWGAAPPASAW